jgi:transposase-like protein
VPVTRKLDRPPYPQLLREVRAIGFSATGRRYGVSDNAVRKWMRAFEHELEKADAVA